MAAVNGNSEIDYSAQRGAKKLAALFNTPDADAVKCQRCQKIVYPKERVTSSRDYKFHKSCFTCSVCGTPLSPANQKGSVDRTDPEIYCIAHVPKLKGTSLGLDSQGVLSFVELSKLAQKMKKVSTIKAPNIGGDASWITGALEAQKLNRYGGKAEEVHSYPALLVSYNESFLDTHASDKLGLAKH